MPKTDKPSDTPESYRPINLLLKFEKIFENFFLKILITIALRQNTLLEFQFDFRSKHATFL